MSEVAMKVAVRVRPFSRREMEQNQKTIIRVMEDASTLIFDPDEDEDEFFFHGAKQTHRDITKRQKKKMPMEFDSVFHDETNNQEVFETCTKPIVRSVMDGFNCSVFVYGATGAGKTFTMLGSENNPGITFLTMQELFTQMELLGDERKFDIGISYLEIYNENVMNLLTKSGPLKLREDQNGVVVGGLVLKQIHNANELFDLLILGNKNRTQHPTDANQESSRSHAIFQVHIRMTDNKTKVRRTVKLSMIDLAGSERAQSTKCKGLRFKEGANINKSLLALGNCINKLADGCKHIPYRDSNLTRILKDSLGGNCQTLMIANISPSSLTYEDTYNTLKYASRAKKIRTTCKQNVMASNVPKEILVKKCSDQISEIEKLKSENEKLKERNKMMEIQFVEQKAIAKAMQGAGDSASNLSVWHENIDTAFNNYRKVQEKCLMLQSNEKILNLRIKLKEKYEEVRRIITLDGSKTSEDISRIEASIDKVGRETNRIKNEEVARWNKRLKEASPPLEQLKREIAEKKMTAALSTYLQMKNLELENSKMAVKMAHALKINNLHMQESQNWANIMQLSGEIIQDNFLLLRSMGEIGGNMKQKYQTLSKLLQGQRSVKFVEDEPSLAASHAVPEIADVLQLASNDELLTTPNKKRGSEDDDEEMLENDSKKLKNSTAMEDFQFLRPAALKSINFDSMHSMNSVSSVKNDYDLDTTFDVNGHAVNETVILSERSNKATTSSMSSISSGRVAKPVKPSGSSTKHTLSIQKENKKYSPGNRMKKVARTPVAASRANKSKDQRPKLLQSAVASSLVLMPGKDKLNTLGKKV